MTMDGGIAFVSPTSQAPTPSQAPATPQTVQLSRDLILDATWCCLRDTGYDGTTIRRIASVLGCSVGSIYRYFKDKHELLLAVTQRLLVPARDLAEAASAFERSVRAYHEQAIAHTEAYRLMFWLTAARGKPQDNGNPSTDGPLPPIVSQIIGFWSSEIGDAVLAHQCWALLHGAIMLGQPADSVLDILKRLSAQATPAADVPPTPEQRFLNQE